MPTEVQEAQKKCQSQQTAGKSCREDSWLKSRPTLWCKVCEEAETYERAVRSMYGLGYI